jgi:hypothetical protein
MWDLFSPSAIDPIRPLGRLLNRHRRKLSSNTCREVPFCGLEEVAEPATDFKERATGEPSCAQIDHEALEGREESLALLLVTGVAHAFAFEIAIQFILF